MIQIAENRIGMAALTGILQNQAEMNKSVNEIYGAFDSKALSLERIPGKALMDNSTHNKIWGINQLRFKGNNAIIERENGVIIGSVDIPPNSGLIFPKLFENPITEMQTPLPMVYGGGDKADIPQEDLDDEVPPTDSEKAAEVLPTIVQSSIPVSMTIAISQASGTISLITGSVTLQATISVTGGFAGFHYVRATCTSVYGEMRLAGYFDTSIVDKSYASNFNDGSPSSLIRELAVTITYRGTPPGGDTAAVFTVSLVDGYSSRPLKNMSGSDISCTFSLIIQNTEVIWAYPIKYRWRVGFSATDTWYDWVNETAQYIPPPVDPDPPRDEDLLWRYQDPAQSFGLARNKITKAWTLGFWYPDYDNYILPGGSKSVSVTLAANCYPTCNVLSTKNNSPTWRPDLVHIYVSPTAW